VAVTRALVLADERNEVSGMLPWARTPRSGGTAAFGDFWPRLIPSKLIEWSAALIPPPRIHNSGTAVVALVYARNVSLRAKTLGQSMTGTGRTLPFINYRAVHPSVFVWTLPS